MFPCFPVVNSRALSCLIESFNTPCFLCYSSPPCFLSARSITPLSLCSFLSQMLTYLSKIISCPEGAEAMTLDIEKFHCRTPICLAQKCWFVMQGHVSEFFIQHCAPFGACSSEGNSGEVSSCSVDIWKCQGVGPTSK